MFGKACRRDVTCSCSLERIYAIVSMLTACVRNECTCSMFLLSRYMPYSKYACSTSVENKGYFPDKVRKGGRDSMKRA